MRQGYPLPLAGLRVVLSILSFSQEVRKHQRFEWSGSGRSWVTERVHHTEISPVSNRAERAGAQAPGRVQTVHSNHVWGSGALWEIINSSWGLDLQMSSLQCLASNVQLKKLKSLPVGHGFDSQIMQELILVNHSGLRICQIHKCESSIQETHEKTQHGFLC